MREDGLFETMLMEKGEILLKELHYDRLFRGMDQLGIPRENLSIGKIEEEIKLSCRINNCGQLARVRLSVFKDAGFLVETKTIEQDLRNSKKGLLIGIYPRARKIIDEFSNIKSTNYSLYFKAAMYAKENGFDDCLLLNNKGNICESSISNVFIVKDREIFTPSLDEGCIEGVMRKWLISVLRNNAHPVKETSIPITMLETADEIFLTNAIRGIRWVKQFKNWFYKNTISSTIIE